MYSQSLGTEVLCFIGKLPVGSPNMGNRLAILKVYMTVRYYESPFHVFAPQCTESTDFEDQNLHIPTAFYQQSYRARCRNQWTFSISDKTSYRLIEQFYNVTFWHSNVKTNTFIKYHTPVHDHDLVHEDLARSRSREIGV